MKVRPQIARALWAGAGLIVVFVVSALLWLWLSALGDHAGAGGARGVALVAGVCFALDVVVLVVLLAIAQLQMESPLDIMDEHD